MPMIFFFFNLLTRLYLIVIIFILVFLEKSHRFQGDRQTGKGGGVGVVEW